ncbi:ABC transporter substrate-binding protein [Psychromicrobium xiongbiense]|uniref:ABC transporter substrate-binding protein n=1 Tax=Psychromicrobium xiongbiense TaxID=3051184 RepID=UPI002554DC39|nr:ABC transporter substrate-binding protein [Psychromicrobium sp. YIM S02556]
MKLSLQAAPQGLLRTGALALAAVFAAGMLASCSSGSSDASSTATKDEAVFALKEDPGCLDPQQVTLTTALNVSRQMVDSLLDQDPKSGKIVPWLATTWKSNDTLTEFSFTLRDGVTFSDGSALTADAVKANFDALAKLGPAKASLASQYLAGYTGTTVTDPKSFKVTFSAPNAQFLQGSTTTTLGLVAQKSTEATADQRCQGIVGSGPFTLTSYTKNDSVNIAQRAGYNWGSELRGHQGVTYVKSVRFPIIAENSVRTGGLASGEFDLIQDLPYADEARFTNDKYHLFAAANPGVPNSLIANTTKGFLGDVNVRKALMMGTNRQEINDLTGSRSGKAPTSALTSSTPGYTSQADLMKFDPQGAKALLQKDGWTLGSDGYFAKDGKKLTLTVTAFYAQDVFEAAQIQLKKVGIDLQLKMVTSGDFFGAIASGNYELIGGALTRTDPDVLRVLLSKNAKSHWGIIDDPQLEDLLAKQAQTADTAARQKLIDDAQKRIIDQAYLVPLLETVQLHGASAKTTGLVFDSASRINLYDLRVAP